MARMWSSATEAHPRSEGTIPAKLVTHVVMVMYESRVSKSFPRLKLRLSHIVSNIAWTRIYAVIKTNWKD